MSKNSNKNFIEQTIRVNHAGEFGAKRIYEGQIKYLKNENSCIRCIWNVGKCNI